jgi:hypothetical protein
MFSAKYPPRSLDELVSDLRRIGLGVAYALRPKRVAALPFVAMRQASGLSSRSNAPPRVAGVPADIP